MRHDWVFDVLSDLHSYATRNDLPGLAEKVEAAMSEARREISGHASAFSTLIPMARRRPH
jgi:hypothetical protein